jgi:hypothetical protein
LIFGVLILQPPGSSYPTFLQTTLVVSGVNGDVGDPTGRVRIIASARGLCPPRHYLQS